MTLYQARDILDRVRAGDDSLSAGEITVALRETGDIPDQAVRLHSAVGTWERLFCRLRSADPFDGLAA